MIILNVQNPKRLKSWMLKSWKLNYGEGFSVFVIICRIIASCYLHHVRWTLALLLSLFAFGGRFRWVVRNTLWQWWKLQFKNASFFYIGIASNEWNSQTFNELKLHLPQEASEVTDWFKNNFVHGGLRRHLCSGVAVSSPLLLLSNLWCVYQCMQNGFPCPQNNMAQKMEKFNREGSHRCISSHRRISKRAGPCQKWIWTCSTRKAIS